MSAESEGQRQEPASPGQPAPHPRKGILARVHPKPYTHRYLLDQHRRRMNSPRESAVTQFNCIAP